MRQTVISPFPALSESYQDQTRSQLEDLAYGESQPESSLELYDENVSRINASQIEPLVFNSPSNPPSR